MRDTLSGKEHLLKRRELGTKVFLTKNPRYYLISVIVALNLCTIAGFGVIDCVLGGTTLSAVSGGSIDATAGIVIIALIAMVVCFGGMRVLHQYERYSWIFALIAIIIATGVGGKHLSNQVVNPPATAATIVGYGGVVAGFLIPWAVRIEKCCF
jgi:purine-cytosine permease-like protein